MRYFEHPRMRVSSSRELTGSSQLRQAIRFEHSVSAIAMRVFWERVGVFVWLAKAAVEGDIAMKLNITEPSVQAYIAGGYQAERTEPLCCSSDGNVSFAQSAERPGSRTAFA